MNRFCKLIVAFIVFSCSCVTSANAASITTAGDIAIGTNVFGAFEDSSTGRTWLKLDNFFGSTWTTDSIVAMLSGSGFHLATISDLTSLQSSVGDQIPTGNSWTAIATIMGGDYLGRSGTAGRELLWGVMNDQDGDALASFSYMYSDTSPADTWINPPNFNAYNKFSSFDTLAIASSGNNDLGAWVVSDQFIPEPTSVALLASGFLGFAASRRKS